MWLFGEWLLSFSNFIHLKIWSLVYFPLWIHNILTVHSAANGTRSLFKKNSSYSLSFISLQMQEKSMCFNKKIILKRYWLLFIQFSLWNYSFLVDLLLQLIICFTYLISYQKQIHNYIIYTRLCKWKIQ